MASFSLVDGRERPWQWDTGVQFVLSGCQGVTECHFSTSDGVISRSVVDGVCSVPDAALRTSGMLRFYAFGRTEDGGTTRYNFNVLVNDRPKPADYIDPPDETDTVDLIAKRVVEMIDVNPDEVVTQETDPTVPDWAKQPNKPTYTADEVGAADAQETARAISALSEEKADKFTVGDGLQMDDGVLGVYRQKMELIETITVEGSDVKSIVRTAEPDGTPYNFDTIFVYITISASSVTSEMGILVGRGNEYYDNAYLNIRPNANDTYAVAKIRAYNGVIDVEGSSVNNTYGGNISMMQRMLPTPFTGDSIKQLNVSGNNPNNLPDKSVIRVYGRRA